MVRIPRATAGSASAQRGLTLVELLVCVAIAAILVVPLFVAVRSGTGAQASAAAAMDTDQQARFALQRMAAAVQRTPAATVLGAKASATTSGSWLAPVAFCLNGSGSIIETTPADTTCAGTTVIAGGATVFSVQTYAAGAGAAPVIEIQLTLSGSQGATTALTARTRLGGGTL